MGDVFTSVWNALEEQPYLNLSPEATGIERELMDCNSKVALDSVSSKMLKDSPIAGSMLLAYLNAFMGGNIYFDVLGSQYTAKPLNKLLSKQFQAMDINRQYDLNMVNEYLITGAFKSGDILLHMAHDKDYINNATGLSSILELITSDRILTPWDEENNPLVRNGVVYATNGRILGYYVLPIDAVYADYTTMNKKDFKFVPLWKEFKIGGNTYTRQVSYMFKSPLWDEAGTARNFSPLIVPSKYIRYIDKDIKAIIIGMYTAACHAAFISSNNPAGAKKQFEAGSSLNGIGKLSPGTVYYLRKGETVTFGSPQRPSDNTDTFITKMLVISSASLRIPYELAFLHLANTSFSSWKGGANEVMSNRNRWLNRLNKATNFIANTYAFEALVNGQITNSLENIRYQFRYPKFDPLDREKVARSTRLDLESQVTTRREEIEDRNLSYRDVEDQLTQEELDSVKRKAIILAEIKSLEKEYDVVFDTGSEEDNKNVNKTKDKTEDKSVDDESKLEIRRQDGNE